MSLRSGTLPSSSSSTMRQDISSKISRIMPFEEFLSQSTRVRARIPSHEQHSEQVESDDLKSIISFESQQANSTAKLLLPLVEPLEQRHYDRNHLKDHLQDMIKHLNEEELKYSINHPSSFVGDGPELRDQRLYSLIEFMEKVMAEDVINFLNATPANVFFPTSNPNSDAVKLIRHRCMKLAASWHLVSTEAMENIKKMGRQLSKKRSQAQILIQKGNETKSNIDIMNAQYVSLTKYYESLKKKAANQGLQSLVEYEIGVNMPAVVDPLREELRTTRHIQSFKNFMASLEAPKAVDSSMHTHNNFRNRHQEKLWGNEVIDGNNYNNPNLANSSPQLVSSFLPDTGLMDHPDKNMNNQNIRTLDVHANIDLSNLSDSSGNRLSVDALKVNLIKNIELLSSLKKSSPGTLARVEGAKSKDFLGTSDIQFGRWESLDNPNMETQELCFPPGHTLNDTNFQSDMNCAPVTTRHDFQSDQNHSHIGDLGPSNGSSNIDRRNDSILASTENLSDTNFHGPQDWQQLSSSRLHENGNNHHGVQNYDRTYHQSFETVQDKLIKDQQQDRHFIPGGERFQGSHYGDDDDFSGITLMEMAAEPVLSRYYQEEEFPQHKTNSSNEIVETSDSKTFLQDSDHMQNDIKSIISQTSMTPMPPSPSDHRSSSSYYLDKPTAENPTIRDVYPSSKHLGFYGHSTQAGNSDIEPQVPILLLPPSASSMLASSNISHNDSSLKNPFADRYPKPTFPAPTISYKSKGNPTHISETPMSSNNNFVSDFYNRFRSPSNPLSLKYGSETFIGGTSKNDSPFLSTFELKYPHLQVNRQTFNSTIAEANRLSGIYQIRSMNGDSNISTRSNTSTAFDHLQKNVISLVNASNQIKSPHHGEILLEKIENVDTNFSNKGILGPVSPLYSSHFKSNSSVAMAPFSSASNDVFTSPLQSKSLAHKMAMKNLSIRTNLALSGKRSDRAELGAYESSTSKYSPARYSSTDHYANLSSDHLNSKPSWLSATHDISRRHKTDGYFSGDVDGTTLHDSQSISVTGHPLMVAPVKPVSLLSPSRARNNTDFLRICDFNESGYHGDPSLNESRGARDYRSANKIYDKLFYQHSSPARSQYISKGQIMAEF